MTDPTQTQQSTDISPAHQLLPMMLGVAQTQLLRVAAQLGIADLLKGEPKSLEELAEVTDTQAAALLRIMRALIHLGIFAETETGKFICTPLGELLQADNPNSLRNYAILMSSDWLNRVWSNLLHSVQTGESAFEDVFGVNFYAYFQEHPDAGTVLNNAMTEISKQEGVALRDAYDFSAFHTVVDVGGGRGLLLAT
ncbi:MAG TPA: methyltransferase, partial [Candidatus Binatia bacterium]|nr:methyltransferase [Candidatus Binatia bacterium]